MVNFKFVGGGLVIATISIVGAVWLLSIGAGIPPTPQVSQAQGGGSKTSRSVNLRGKTGANVRFDVPAICQEISNSQFKITPSEAEALLGRLKNEIPDAAIRASLASSIIDYLCKNGYDREAWSLIESGYGIQRELQLRAYFAASKHPDTLELLNTLSDKGERNRAIDGYLRGLSVDEIASFDLSKLGGKGALSGVLANNLAINMAPFVPGKNVSSGEKSQNSSVISAGLAKIRSGDLNVNDFYNSILKKDHTTDAFEKMTTISGVGIDDTEISKSQLNGVKGHIVDSMIYADAPRSMGLLTEMDSDPDMLEGAIQNWLTIDSNLANQWCSKNLSQLSQIQRDYIASGMVKHAMQYGDHEAAHQWYQQIQTPKIRSSLESRFK